MTGCMEMFGKRGERERECHSNYSEALSNKINIGNKKTTARQ